MRRIIGAILLGSLFGCTTFGPVSPKEFVIAKRPQQVWVWKADSSVVLVRGPHFLPGSDTLVGMVDGEYRELPLSDVTQVKASRPAPVRTAALVIGGVGAVVGTALIIKKGSGQSNECNSATCDPSLINP
jgi:hypothetical protein